MPTASRSRSAFDRSSLVAYAGAGAAIAFIAAMTFGAIDAPSVRPNWIADASAPEATRIVSIAPTGGQSSIR